MKDVPLPQRCRFNFTLTSSYANASHEKISEEPQRVLENELHRLGMRIPEGRTNSELADSIVNFTKCKGFGHSHIVPAQCLGFSDSIQCPKGQRPASSVFPKS